MATLLPNERADYDKWTTAIGINLSVNETPNILDLQQAEQAYVNLTDVQGEQFRTWTVPPARAKFSIPAIAAPLDAAAADAADADDADADISVNIIYV